jgi:hypothetical protein
LILSDLSLGAACKQMAEVEVTIVIEYTEKRSSELRLLHDNEPWKFPEVIKDDMYMLGVPRPRNDMVIWKEEPLPHVQLKWLVPATSVSLPLRIHSFSLTHHFGSA